MSDAEVNGLFTSLAANAKIAKGHTVMGELLSAGEFDTAVSIYSHTVDNAAAKGAPVAWKSPRQARSSQWWCAPTAPG